MYKQDIYIYIYIAVWEPSTTHVDARTTHDARLRSSKIKKASCSESMHVGLPCLRTCTVLQLPAMHMDNEAGQYRDTSQHGCGRDVEGAPVRTGLIDACGS